MLKLKAVKSVNTSVEVCITPEVKTYNIITQFMSDYCIPYRVAQSVMIWVTKEGFLGELESIYPITIDKTLCDFSDKVSRVEGFPQFEICSCDNEAYIQQIQDGFIIWFAANKTIDTDISYNCIDFLMSENELVAIKIREVVGA